MTHTARKRLLVWLPILVLAVMTVLALTASPALVFAEEHEAEEVEAEEVEADDPEAEEVEAEEPEVDEVDVEEPEEPVAEDLPETGFDFLPYGIGGGALILVGLAMALAMLRKRADKHTN